MLAPGTPPAGSLGNLKVGDMFNGSKVTSVGSDYLGLEDAPATPSLGSSQPSGFRSFRDILSGASTQASQSSMAIPKVSTPEGSSSGFRSFRDMLSGGPSAAAPSTAPAYQPGRSFSLSNFTQPGSYTPPARSLSAGAPPAPPNPMWSSIIKGSSLAGAVGNLTNAVTKTPGEAPAVGAPILGGLQAATGAAKIASAVTGSGPTANRVIGGAGGAVDVARGAMNIFPSLAAAAPAGTGTALGAADVGLQAANVAVNWDKMNDIQKGGALAKTGVSAAQFLAEKGAFGAAGGAAVAQYAGPIGAAVTGLMSGLEGNREQTVGAVAQELASVAMAAVAAGPGAPFVIAAYAIGKVVGGLWDSSTPNYAIHRTEASNNIKQNASTMFDHMLMANSPEELENARRTFNGTNRAQMDKDGNFQSYESDLSALNKVAQQIRALKTSEFAGKISPEAMKSIQAVKEQARGRMEEKKTIMSKEIGDIVGNSTETGQTIGVNNAYLKNVLGGDDWMYNIAEQRRQENRGKYAPSEQDIQDQVARGGYFGEPDGGRQHATNDLMEKNAAPPPTPQQQQAMELYGINSSEARGMSPTQLKRLLEGGTNYQEVMAGKAYGQQPEPSLAKSAPTAAAPPPEPTLSQAQAEKDRGQIPTLYTGILDRNPDESGIAAWQTGLQKNGPFVTISGFFLSPEYNLKSKSPEKIVTDMYQGVLGREPDAAGLPAWVDAYNKYGFDVILQGFLQSQEGKARWFG